MAKWWNKWHFRTTSRNTELFCRSRLHRNYMSTWIVDHMLSLFFWLSLDQELLWLVTKSAFNAVKQTGLDCVLCYSSFASLVRNVALRWKVSAFTEQLWCDLWSKATPIPAQSPVHYGTGSLSSETGWRWGQMKCSEQDSMRDLSMFYNNSKDIIC